MKITGKKDLIYLLLSGFFITNAIIAEVTGGKLIQIGYFTMSIGIIPWPVVFITTDIINEYYGKQGVRRITMVTACLILYAFIILFIGTRIKASAVSPVDDYSFLLVFGQSLWIIAGSLTAFLASQLIDVSVFWFVRKKTGSAHIWLRATGSTAISQLADTFIVLGIGFLLPGKLSFHDFINLAITNYTFKLIIAIAVTPLIYAGHALVDKVLGKGKPDISEKPTPDRVLLSTPGDIEP